MQSDDLPSVCIPRVSQRITKDYIVSIFNKLDWGELEAIHIIPKGDGNQIVIDYKKSRIINKKTASIRGKLLAGEIIKVVHNEPWFWKCGASRYTKQKYQ